MYLDKESSTWRITRIPTNGILFLLVFGLSYQGKAIIIVFRFFTKSIIVALRDFGP